MLIALEGSSPTIFGENNYKYYVWDFFNAGREFPKMYHPGPATISGSGSLINIRKMAVNAVSFIHKHQGKIFLVGWSRGAAACIQVAHYLAISSNKTIDAMFLFDAVDRDTSTSSDLNYIPNSVNNVYHAVATDKNWFWGNIFLTVGKTAHRNVNLVIKNFNVSHGAIAGTESNDGGSRKWMEGHLKSEGVI